MAGRHKPAHPAPSKVEVKNEQSNNSGHVARMGDRRKSYRVLVEKCEGKSLLERPRRKWEDNIKIYI
jgi:hypothetical protein